MLLMRRASRRLDFSPFKSQTINQPEFVGLQHPGTQAAQLGFWQVQASLLLIQPQGLLLQSQAVAAYQCAGLCSFFPDNAFEWITPAVGSQPIRLALHADIAGMGAAFMGKTWR